MAAEQWPCTRGTISLETTRWLRSNSSPRGLTLDTSRRVIGPWEVEVVPSRYEYRHRRPSEHSGDRGRPASAFATPYQLPSGSHALEINRIYPAPTNERKRSPTKSDKRQQNRPISSSISFSLIKRPVRHPSAIEGTGSGGGGTLGRLR